EQGPRRHQREDELVVAVGHEGRHHQVGDRQRGERRQVAPEPRTGALPHARSADRPNSPCGRSSTIMRNTTKIAAFCSCGGRIRAENCWTKPTVNPPQNAPRMLPMPPSKTPEYMMIRYAKPTKGPKEM